VSLRNLNAIKLIPIFQQRNAIAPNMVGGIYSSFFGILEPRT